jgi:hypothetical protein
VQAIPPPSWPSAAPRAARARPSSSPPLLWSVNDAPCPPFTSHGASIMMCCDDAAAEPGGGGGGGGGTKTVKERLCDECNEAAAPSRGVPEGRPPEGPRARLLLARRGGGGGVPPPPPPTDEEGPSSWHRVRSPPPPITHTDTQHTHSTHSTRATDGAAGH